MYIYLIMVVVIYRKFSAYLRISMNEHFFKVLNNLLLSIYNSKDWVFGNSLALSFNFLCFFLQNCNKNYIEHAHIDSSSCGGIYFALINMGKWLKITTKKLRFILYYIYIFDFKCPKRILWSSTEDSWCCLYSLLYYSSFSHQLGLLQLLYKCFFVLLSVLDDTVLFYVSLYLSYVYVIVQFSCFLIIMDNCQNSTFLTGVKTPYAIYIVAIFRPSVISRRCILSDLVGVN